MWKNLYQKTMYEAYKTKEHLGYKIVEFENMFAVLWNNQNVPYYNIIHCDKFGQKELDIIKQNIPDTFLCIASNHEIVEDLANVKKGHATYLMKLDVKEKIINNSQFKIVKVSDLETLKQFCDIAAEVYDLTKDKDELIKSFANETNLENCFKYVGYINDEPAGMIEFSEGKNAAYASWGAVREKFRRQGLYKAIFAYAINYEFDRGIKTILLNSSEMGKEAYKKMGFVPLTSRYNYVLDK